MSTSPAPLELGILLNLAFGAVKERLHLHLASAGFDDLGPSFGYVLRVLEGAAPSLAQLSERLGMTAQGALKIVDEMVQRGYVVRTEDPHDGRVRRLQLTPRGKRVLQEARKFYAGYERQLTQRLGTRQVAAARAVLDTIVGDGEAAGLERQARPF